MSVFILVSAFLALIVAKSGGAIRPVVTFTPNWGNILPGDSVTLTCNVTTAPEEPRTYHWYKDNQPIPRDNQNLEIRPSREDDSGDYRCWVNGGDISDPVTLSVKNTHLILQRPPSAIYEGDPLTLRCHHLRGFVGSDTIFYKNNMEIQSQYFDEIHIHPVDLHTAARYKCTKQIAHPDISTYTELSDEFSVSVRELFSPPEIKTAFSSVKEGDNMEVTCVTRLDPPRASTELQFAFYRDGRTVQEFSGSDKYRVRSAQLEDSGNYTCDVRTATNTVRKRSDGLYIQIHGRAVLIIVLSVAIVGGLLLIVLSAVIIWRCKNKKESPDTSQGSPEEAATMVADANPDPEDVCYTYLELSHLPKGNTVRNDNQTVTYATVVNPDP